MAVDSIRSENAHETIQPELNLNLHVNITGYLALIILSLHQMNQRAMADYCNRIILMNKIEAYLIE